MLSKVYKFLIVDSRTAQYKGYWLGYMPIDSDADGIIDTLWECRMLGRLNPDKVLLVAARPSKLDKPGLHLQHRMRKRFYLWVGICLWFWVNTYLYPSTDAYGYSLIWSGFWGLICVMGPK